MPTSPILPSVTTTRLMMTDIVGIAIFAKAPIAGFGAEHPYGVGCYRPGSCADILQIVAGQLDASRYNPRFPTVFPRFVQHAVWRYCANEGLDVCNGNQIDDDVRCRNRICRLYNICDRHVLRNQPKSAISDVPI